MIEPRDRDWGAKGDWSPLPKIEAHIPALLEVFRTTYANNEILVLDDRRTTYGEVEAKSAILARQLIADGVGKGTRIGILMASDETFLISWMAITRIGAVAVTISTLSTPDEILRIARHADLHLLFVSQKYLHHDYVERIAKAFPSATPQRAPYRLAEAPCLRDIRFWAAPDAEPVPAWAKTVDLTQEPGVGADLLAGVEAGIHPGDVAGIIYTSGSTAEPKGVIHSHGNFVRSGMKLAVSFRYGNQERIFASMPFFWVGGLVSNGMCIMTVGGTMLNSNKTGKEMLDFLEEERLTAVVAWPHQMRAWAADPSFPGRKWSHMRLGLFYETLPKETRPADPGLMSTPIGMTETTGPYTIIPAHIPEEQRGSVGMPMRGVDIRLVDTETGEVIGVWLDGDDNADSGGRAGVMHLRVDTMMLGMVRRENADVFTDDGWYNSGDVCLLRKGFLHYQARADDLIKTAGALVSPKEVENVLMKLPGVASAIVQGVADAERTAAVAAVVVPQPGVALDLEAVRKEAAKALSSYKVPRTFVVMEASKLPSLASSKVDRLAVKKILQDAHDAG